MSKRRKNRRMHTREQRRAATAERAALPPPTQEQQDRSTILGSYDEKIYDSPAMLAESWLGERDDLVSLAGDAPDLAESAKILLRALEYRERNAPAPRVTRDAPTTLFPIAA